MIDKEVIIVKGDVSFCSFKHIHHSGVFCINFV
jgi:hypothetical protein